MFDLTQLGSRPSVLRMSPLSEGIVMFARAVFTVHTLPVEYAIRPWFGTCWFDPLHLFVAGVMMTFLGVLGLFASFVSEQLPFSPAIPKGAIGLGWLFILFVAATIAHLIRLYPKIKDQTLEPYAESEGPELPLFRWLPYGQSYFVVRCYYEPALVMVIAVVGLFAGLFTMPVAFFFVSSAHFLAARNFLDCFLFWKRVRIRRDGEFEARAFAAILTSKPTREQLRAARMPAASAAQIEEVRNVARQERTSLPPEIANLLSTPEKAASSAETSESVN